MFGYSKEAVRVKVKKCEGKLQSELRKFSVDPQITSLEVLLSILVKAFDIKSDFTLSYRSVDDYGQEMYLPLLSDWDLDAAFLKAHNIALTQHSEPCVQLRVDMKPFAEASEDWEPPSMSPPIPCDIVRDQPTVAPPQQPEKQEISGFQGLIMNQVEKTFNMVSRALNLYDDPNTPPRPPLSDSEFRSFLNTVGQITNTTKLREVIYCGGIDPSLRKVVWKHILNVYPDGMTGKERMDYIKKKANEYYALRAKWKDCIQKGKVNADLAYVTSMVRKDVLRTDRHHNFYAGSDDNQNIASLFNILTTYALNHPRVSYCQGMSDLASPLLVTMRDEAHAYICLCALMARLHSNFLLDGETMTLKFAHLTESLQVYDPDFYTYLKSQQADDLLFCYRWLLLEMKREFAFEDALRMLEVLWASLPQGAPPRELALHEQQFAAAPHDQEPPPPSPLLKAPRENAYTKVCAMRRQSSSFNLANKPPTIATCKQINHSLDENATRDPEDGSSLKQAKIFQSLDDTTLQTIQSKADDDDVVTNKENSLGKDLKLHVRKNVKSLPENETKTSNSGNLLNGKPHSNGNDTSLGGQIRLLRDKISVHNNKFDGANDTDSSYRPKVKMIKNLNEFLNFATGSNPNPARHERLQRAHSAIETTKEYPKITLTKMSMDESDLGKQTVRDSLMNKINRNIYNDTNDGSSPDDSQEYYPMTTSMTRELRLELEHLDRQVFGPSYASRCNMICDSPTDSTGTEERGAGDRGDTIENPEPKIAPDKRIEFVEAPDATKRSPLPETVKASARSAEDIYLWENPLHLHTPPARASASLPHTPDEQAELELDDSGDIFELHSGRTSVTPIRLLRAAPAPAPAGDSDSASLAPPAPDQAPGPSRDPAPHPAGDPAPHPAGDPAPHPAGDPAPHPAGDLAPHPAGDPAPHPAREPAPDPAPDPTGDPAPETPRADASKSHKFFSNMSQELENAKRNCESLLNAKPANLHSVASTINNFQKKYEALKPPAARVGGAGGAGGAGGVAGLPPPGAFGGGNPFLMFLCLTLLLQHRDYVMRNRMDYNELAMHFDKMVRKHDVTRVLNQARHMYALYLKHHARDRAV